jgi:hypothetical protein
MIACRLLLKLVGKFKQRNLQVEVVSVTPQGTVVLHKRARPSRETIASSTCSVAPYGIGKLNCHFGLQDGIFL